MTEGATLGALFLSSFLAATLLPMASEAVLVAILATDPALAATAIAVATAGNTLGGLTSYGLGRLIPGRLPQRMRVDPAALERLRRYGPAVLLASWVPVIGDALCVAAGWLRLPLAACAAAILAGKLGRYLVVAWVTLAATG